MGKVSLENTSQTSQDFSDNLLGVERHKIPLNVFNSKISPYLVKASLNPPQMHGEEVLFKLPCQAQAISMPSEEDPKYIEVSLFDCEDMSIKRNLRQYKI